MQLGLYLPGLAALSGVQSLRILDSYELAPAHLPEPTLAVHGEGKVEKPAKAGVGAVENGVTFEKRDHTLDEIDAIAYDEHERSISTAVRSDATASKPLLNQSEHLIPVTVLADMELRYQLRPDAARRLALHRDREAAFSVDVTRDVAIQPFLLIVRTRHVVTIVNVRPGAHDK